jgi:hypothetical protein
MIHVVNQTREYTIELRQWIGSDAVRVIVEGRGQLTLAILRTEVFSSIVFASAVFLSSRGSKAGNSITSRASSNTVPEPMTGDKFVLFCTLMLFRPIFCQASQQATTCFNNFVKTRGVDSIGPMGAGATRCGRIQPNSPKTLSRYRKCLEKLELGSDKNKNQSIGKQEILERLLKDICLWYCRR